MDLRSLTRADAKSLALSVHQEFMDAGAVDDDFTLELTRYVELPMLLKAAGAAPGRMVDVGCGNGYMLRICQEAGFEVEGFDFYGFELEQSIGGHDRDLTSRYKAVWDRHRISVRGCDVSQRRLPLDDASCDLVLCCAVLEHLLHPPTFALQELARLVRPGGLVVVEVPNLADLRNRLLLGAGESIHMPLDQLLTSSYLGHTREYTVAEVHAMLRFVGLEPVRTACFNNETVRRGLRLRRWQQLGLAKRTVWRLVRAVSAIRPTWRQAVMVAARRQS